MVLVHPPCLHHNHIPCLQVYHSFQNQQFQHTKHLLQKGSDISHKSNHCNQLMVNANFWQLESLEWTLFIQTINLFHHLIFDFTFSFCPGWQSSLDQESGLQWYRYISILNPVTLVFQHTPVFSFQRCINFNAYLCAFECKDTGVTVQSYASYLIGMICESYGNLASIGFQR